MILYVYTVHHYDFWLWLPNQCPTFFQLEFSSIVCSCCRWFKDDAIGCLHCARIRVCLKIAQCLVMFCYLGGNSSKKGKNIYILFSKYAEHFRFRGNIMYLECWFIITSCPASLFLVFLFGCVWSVWQNPMGSAGSTGGCSWQRDNGRRGGKELYR